MTDALPTPGHVMVDRITWSLSHCVSLVVVLDAAELAHDEELESTLLRLQRLEGELKTQQKLVWELQTVAHDIHSQAQTYEARVTNLESDIAS